MKKTLFSQAINEALIFSMKKNKNVICFGLGVTDPKAVFGTTAKLEKYFGKDRVFDTPTSENGMTGIAIGSSLNGKIPVVVHQRLDFFLLAMDQLVNNAAKWFYMFGGQKNVPITIRLIIGRGWGQGPTHSQNLHSWFSHIPGLKVVMPSNPEDAKGLLINSIFDPDPVIFLEHRWLHNSLSKKKLIKNNTIKIGKGKIILKGNDITIVAMSYLVPEALKASEYLKNHHNINAEIIDLRTIKPLDLNMIKKSFIKTGRVLALDTGFARNSVASDIVSQLSIDCFNDFRSPPKILTMPDVPEPTSFGLTKGFYIRPMNIVKTVLDLLNIKDNKIKTRLKEPKPHDIPGNWFKGPF